MTLAIISISYDATVLIMLIPEFWEYSNISTTKSDRARPAVRRPDFKQGILKLGATETSKIPPSW